MMILNALGYRVLLPKNGSEINLEAGLPDITFVYLDFPQQNGIKAILDLKANPKTQDIPIVVFLPLGLDQAAKAALDAGTTEVVSDPLAGGALSASLEKHRRQTFTVA